MVRSYIKSIIFHQAKSKTQSKATFIQNNDQESIFENDSNAQVDRIAKRIQNQVRKSYESYEKYSKR